MDMNYAESWVSQPDVCRCCLAASGIWDVTASYITKTGEKVVYSDMLKECYGVTLSFLQQFGPSRMVCELCVGRLRDAVDFKKQVQLVELKFVTYQQNRESCMSQSVIDKTAADDDDENSSHSFKDSNINILTDSINCFVVDEINRQDLMKEKDRVKTERDEDVDSDTPISEIIKNNNLIENVANDNNDSYEFDSVTSEKIVGKNFVYTRPKDVKQLSERKRVILTCNTVLKDTTACPFRHHKSWFQCFFCQQEFFEINLLRDHTIKIHSNIDDELKKIKRYPRSLQIEISNLECRHCNLNLTDVVTMRRHFVDVHKKIIYNECIADYKVNNSPYSCHLCGQEFHVFRSLTTHLNEHYANCICDVCGKSFINSKRLKVHKRTHENGHFPCLECGKVLKTKISKANHMESHSKRVIKCQICFKPMKHYNDRIKHMSEVHNITHKFKCPFCDRVYNIKHYLSTHIRQTHGHKNKKCIECDMAFITNHGLKKHMLKHSGIKPFSCDVCCKAYSRSYSLREHMRSHENDT